jgi:hypothetical protein
MAEPTSQGAALFNLAKKKGISIPRIRIPGGGKLKVVIIVFYPLSWPD